MRNLNKVLYARKHTNMDNPHEKILPPTDAPALAPQPVEEVEEMPPLPGLHRLVVFGGTFDPIHLGHINLAEKILELGLGNEVMFVPAHIPPHKKGNAISTAKHRLAMLKLVVDENKQFSYSDIEIQREGNSYTYDTLTILTKAMPDINIAFLMGMDSLVNLHTWHRAPELIQHFNFIIYPRPGFTAPHYAELADKFGIKNAHKLLDSVINAENLPVWDVSSSELKAAIHNGGNLKDYLAPAVWDYIQKEGLYHE